MSISDDSVDETLGRFFGLATILTSSQWMDLHKSKFQSPEQEFWFAWFQAAVNDWKAFHRNPTYTTWKNARDLPSWPNTQSFGQVAEVINSVYNIDEERIKSGFIRWLKIEALKERVKTDPNIKHLAALIENDLGKLEAK